MNYWFSPSKNAFYPVALKNDYISAGTLPDDLIEVNDRIFNEFSGMPKEGKQRISGTDGYPVWGDIPPPTPEEKKSNAEAMRNQLRAAADAEIAWRHDAVDTGIATEEEIANLAEWKKYRVLLMRVDTAAPEWPTPPGEQVS